MNVETSQRLDIKNLITFRKTARAAELQEHMKNLTAYVEAQEAKKVGGGISATYAIDGDKMDIEVYMPIDKEIPSTDEFIFKPRLYLENCIKATHKGNPQLLESTIQKLNEYIVENKLLPISVGFNVTVNEITSPVDMDKFEVDAFVSISPNVI